MSQGEGGAGRPGAGAPPAGTPPTDGGEAGTAVAGQVGSGGQAGEDTSVGGAGGEAGAAPTGDGPVHGRVQSGREPVVGIRVVLGQEQTTTASDGSFTFATAPATYRLSVIHAATHVALVLDGMHGREPVVEFNSPFAQNRSANIHGRLAGATGTAAQFVQVAFTSQTRGCLGRSIMVGAGSAYDVEAYWNGAPSQSGRLWAIAFETETGDVDDLPKNYVGFAQAPLNISEGDQLGLPDGSSATDLTLSAPARQDLLGDVTLPAGYVLDGRSGLDVGPFLLPVKVAAKTGGAYSSVVPRAAELPVAVHFSASLIANGEQDSTLVARAVPTSGRLDFALPPAPKAVSPPNGAQGVTATTPFGWTPPSAKLVVRARFDIASWYIWRMTSEDGTTFPDLSAYGVPFPKGETGHFFVESFGPADDVDAAASLVYDDLGLTGPEYVRTFAGPRTFTIAP